MPAETLEQLFYNKCNHLQNPIVTQLSIQSIRTTPFHLLDGAQSGAPSHLTNRGRYWRLNA
jgi:hypothetical protein